MSRSEPGIVLSHSRDRVEVLFSMMSVIALLKTLPESPGEISVMRQITLAGNDTERLDQARMLAQAMDMELRHRNGYYYAARLDDRSFPEELHFAPAIPFPGATG